MTLNSERRLFINEFMNPFQVAQQRHSDVVLNSKRHEMQNSPLKGSTLTMHFYLLLTDLISRPILTGNLQHITSVRIHLSGS